MSLLARLEQRVSVTDLAHPSTWLATAFGAVTSKSGQTVSEQTALTLSTVYACVRVLAESVASIPLVVYRRLPNGGRERATTHPNYELLHTRPNRDQSSFAWRETVMAHLAMRGNAYVEKEFTVGGTVKALWPIAPSRVEVHRVNGRKQFKVTTTNGGHLWLTDREIMHIPGLSYDGLVGYSPIRLASEAIGLGLASQEHGARFFSNGAEVGGVLQHPGRLTDNAAKHIRESFAARHVGGANAHVPLVAEEGMTWQSVGLSNRDSQYLETRKFQVQEIARIYRVPPHMIGDLERATFSNIEQQSIDFVTHSLRPWLVLMEQVFNWELFGDVKTSKFFCEFNVDGLLRGDSAARAAFYQAMVNTGIFSINDVLMKENMNAVEGGDERFIQGAMVPLSKIAAIAEASIAAKNTPPPPFGAKPPMPDAEADEGEMPPQRARMVDACYRLYRQATERCLTKYVQRARRQAKKMDGNLDAFRGWVDTFFVEERLSARLAFHPATLAMSDWCGVDPARVRGHADQIAGRITVALAAEIRAVDDAAALEYLLAAWETTRADTIATQETDIAVTLLTSLEIAA